MRLFLLFSAVTAAAAVAQPSAVGGGPAPGLDGPSDQMAPTERQALVHRLRAVEDQLVVQGRLAPSASARVVPSLGWPLRYDPAVGDVHGVSNFVDLNPAAGALRDYACNARTYDQADYNHTGVDYFLWPYAWSLMDDASVRVVAAAPGTVLGVDDGNADRSCSITAQGQWNAVYVRHDDGSVATYGHLKKGSTTSKAVGERVAAGEELGSVGSSGRSSGPHLHLEWIDASDAVVEPHAGSCNPGPSAWAEQRPYYNSAVNAVYTHAAAPSFSSCPATQDRPGRVDRFDRVYLATYYRDHLAGQTSRYEIREPSGTVRNTWSHSPSAPFYAASYYYWSFTLSPDAPVGDWTFSVTFEGVTTTRAFRVGAGAVASEARPLAGVVLGHPAPNPAARWARLQVSVDRPRDVRVEVLDVLGRTVAVAHDGPLAPGAPDRVLNTSRLPAGRYVVRVTSEGRAATRPLVVAR